MRRGGLGRGVDSEYAEVGRQREDVSKHGGEWGEKRKRHIKELAKVD